MSQTVDGKSSRELSETLFRSDSFKSFYELFRAFPAFAGLIERLIRVELVIDANVVLSEIRFRLKRRNADARSDLGEAIDSGIVIAIAPKHLVTELDDEHLSRILRGTGKTVVDARREWESLRPKIRLYEPVSEAAPAIRAIDVDDVAYAVTCDETGALAVHSRDKHLKKMGAPVVNGIPDRALRDCARSSTVVMGITATTGFTITITYASLRSAWLVLQKTLEGFRALPAWAKLLIIGAAVAIWAHPKFRADLAERWDRLGRDSKSMVPNFIDTLGQWATTYQEAEQQAAQSRLELQALLPPPRPKTLIQHARLVCLINERPLPLDEILRLMKLDGYQAPSRAARANLRKALRASGQFVETENGEWLMPGPVMESPSTPQGVPTRTRSVAARRRPNNPRLKRGGLPRGAPKMSS